MPAVKKELPGREDLALALATLHPGLAALPVPPLPGYLAPLPAVAALPPAASLPAAAAGYEALLAPPLRAHRPGEPLALGRFSAAAPDFQPLLDRGEPCIEVECGANRALLYVRRLCQGSKGPSIRHRGHWLTPNEFQFVSGRETAKDWKRSIRHRGKSLKTLMSKGILQVHPPICDCPGCRISSPVNRGRLADKRTLVLPPARVLKKELTPSFSPSDGNSDVSRVACGPRPGLKQESDPHIRIMKRRVHTHWDLNISFREASCSQDSDLPTLVSSLCHGGRLVMPEHQSRCDFQTGGVDVGLGATGDLLGKRLGRSSHVSSDCPQEKKARSKSPQETLLLPELGHSMAPEDQYRRLVSALSEAGTFEDPQRLYHLGLPGHDLLRVRQEAAAASSPGGLGAHLPPAAGPRRKQGLAPLHAGSSAAGAPSFSERDLPRPPPLLSPQSAPHIALGPHLRPPLLGAPPALCPPGYGVLPPTPAEVLARQQELLRKQNLARLEMSAELLRHKELDGGHRPPLLAPEGAMLVLRHSSAPVLALPPRPPTPSRAPRRGAPGDPREAAGAALWAHDSSEEEPPKDSDGEDPEMVAGASSPEGKGLLPPLPLGPCVHAGSAGGRFTREAAAPEDVSKWTVDDVCSFVGGLSGCGEYAPVFREQGIDGETLPLLTEQHLLTTMGLKLGPALKIRAQVARRLGRVVYVASFPVSLPPPPPALRGPEQELAPGEQTPSPAAAPSPRRDDGAPVPRPADPPQPLC